MDHVSAINHRFIVFSEPDPGLTGFGK